MCFNGVTRRSRCGRKCFSGYIWQKYDLSNAHFFLCVFDTFHILDSNPEANKFLAHSLHQCCSGWPGISFDKLIPFIFLCYQEQDEGEPFHTTAQDLAGFWDMVLLQVADVDTMFQQLHTLRANGWKTPEKNTPVSQSEQIFKVNSYSASHDNWCTVGGDGGCRVGEVRASTTSPMPDHKGFKLQ